MNELYNIDDGIKILNVKRKINIYLSIIGIIVLFIVCLITFISSYYFVMVIDIILTYVYLFCLYTYVFYFRKRFNEKYHFLAKIEQFEHDYITGNIDVINEDILTIKDFEVYSISINNRTLYIEIDKIPNCFYEGNLIKLDIVDNFIVGYEVYDK